MRSPQKPKKVPKHRVSSPKRILPSLPLRDAVAALIRADGVRGAASVLCVSADDVTRVVADLPVEADTIALMSHRLVELGEDAERSRGHA